MNFQPSWKQEKQFNNCHLAKLQVVDAINAEVYAFGVCGGVGGVGGVTHVRDNHGVVSLYVEEGGYPARI